MSDSYELPASQGGSMATIVFCVAAAALAGLLFGYDTGVAALTG